MLRIALTLIYPLVMISLETQQIMTPKLHQPLKNMGSSG
jgi:hypothetical protein